MIVIIQDEEGRRKRHGSQFGHIHIHRDRVEGRHAKIFKDYFVSNQIYPEKILGGDSACTELFSTPLHKLLRSMSLVHIEKECSGRNQCESIDEEYRGPMVCLDLNV